MPIYSIARFGFGAGAAELFMSCGLTCLRQQQQQLDRMVCVKREKTVWLNWLAVKHAVFLVCTLAVAFGDLVRRNICRKASINIGYNGTPSTGFKALLSYILSLRTAANLKSGPPITTRLVYDTQHIANIFLRSLSKPLSML